MSLNSKWYHLILEVANKAAKIPGVKMLMKPIYYPIKRRIEQSHRRKLMQNGLKVLQIFDKCLTENGIEYTLAFGTLLGAVREKGFIKHDLDIDVSVWGDQYTPRIAEALEAIGFKLIRTFMVEDGSFGREETYQCEGVAIDIFYIQEDGGKYPYYCGYDTIGDTPTFAQSMSKYGRVRARRMDIPMIRERVKTLFEGIEVYIPANAHEILRFIYGEDYMIPNASWEMDPNRVYNWLDKMVYYKEL